MTAAAIEPARGVYLEALRRAPADPCLHEGYAEFLEATHETKAVTAEWRRCASSSPTTTCPF